MRIAIEEATVDETVAEAKRLQTKP